MVPGSEPGPEPPTNRLAVLSLVFAVLTMLFFCIGFAPIPLTALVCYPAALAGGAASIWAGRGALREIREKGEGGRPLALTGLWVSGLTILAVMCSTAFAAWFISYVVEFIRQMRMPVGSPL